MAVKSIPRPELLASLVSKLGKCHRCDLTVAVVIPLQGQLQLVHVLGAGASGFLQTIRIILDSHLYGVVRILDGIGAVGVPSVVWALTALHGICPPAAGFLHHDCLYHRNVFGDSILVGVFLDS